MVVSTQQYQELLQLVEELDERVDGVATRLVGAESVASQHGDEHTDRGLDPIKAANVAGHTHVDPNFPVVRTTNTSFESTAVTSHTVSLPSSILSNDLLIVIFFSGSVAHTVSWPTGWTEFHTHANSDTILAVAYRAADGAEGASITVTTNVSVTSAHNAYRIDDTSKPSTQAPEAASAATKNPPTLDPTGGENNFLWLTACGGDADVNADITSAPSDYSTFINAGGTNTVDLGSARRELRTTSENPATFVATVDAVIAVTIAIHPFASALHGTDADAHHAKYLDSEAVAAANVQDSVSHDRLGDVSTSDHHVTSRPYTYSITFGWDPQSPQVFAP